MRYWCACSAAHAGRDKGWYPDAARALLQCEVVPSRHLSQPSSDHTDYARAAIFLHGGACLRAGRLQSNWKASPGAKLSRTMAEAVAAVSRRRQLAAYRRTAS